MDLDACGVQRDGFDPDTHDLRTLQLLEHAIQDASFGPAIHARVNRVPVAEAFGQSAPLATMFGHIEDRIDHLQIAQADVATLPGQAVFNGSELFGRDLHVGDFLAQSSPSPLVLTRPSLRQVGAWIPPRSSVPMGSVAWRLRSSGISAADTDEIAQDIWFDNWEKGLDLWELARHYAGTDTTTSLLWFDSEDLPEVEVSRFGVRVEDDGGLAELTGQLTWPSRSRRR